MENLNFRYSVESEDADRVGEIVGSSGFFSAEEISIARELVEENLKSGASSGYNFIFAVKGTVTIGYACYGPIPATKFSFELYWIAVHSDWRDKGMGRMLLAECEKNISKMGGRQIYAETSGRDQYAATRSFYRSCGYLEEAVLRDFYAPGDSKHFFVKRLS